MEIAYGKYNFKKVALGTRGDYPKDILFKIENKESGKSFNYIIEISDSAFETGTDELDLNVREAVKTEGDCLVKEWLDEGKEENLQVRITTTGIETI